MSEFEKQAHRLLAQVSALLTARNWRMATAESCTGGLIAKCCTDLAGSSDWFDRAYVAYSYRAKEQMLGVSHDCVFASNIAQSLHAGSDPSKCGSEQYCQAVLPL
jgi:PncC family amidohydrolase